MAYISFYRKWRPQDFDQIVGQDHTVRTLKNAVSGDRLSHSYMFCGPRGTGKTSTARILAKAINCVKGPTSKPCNECENCVSITNGTNVDIVEIDAASNNGVEHIRELREKAKYIPSMLRKKVYIIDEVHMLSTSAFNALLKVLEEPPQHIVFIMATTEPHKVLPTIMSRCQRFDFFPISIEEIVNKLKKISEVENITIDDAALGIIAKYADGSLRDADGILEQLASFGQDKITIDDVTALLGVIDYELLFEFTDILAEKDINKGLLFARRIFSSNQSLEVFVQEFLDHLYNLYVFKNYDRPQEIVDMTGQFIKRYSSQAKRVSQKELNFYIGIYDDLYKRIKKSSGAKTFFKAALIKALNFQSGQEEKEKAALGRQAERSQVSKAAPPKSMQEETAAPKKDKPESGKAGDGDTIGDNWLKICNLIKRSKISVHAMFAEIRAYRLEKDNLCFYLDDKKGWHKQQLSKENNTSIIAKAIKQVTGSLYKISFLTGEDNIEGAVMLEVQDRDDYEDSGYEAGSGHEKVKIKEDSASSEDVYDYLIEKFEIKE
ncbi:MAG: DNA polymerase III subunit gamma/tau [Actinomycetota bacterium]